MSTKEAFSFKFGEDEIPSLEGAVFQAIGAAGAGEFDPEHAKEVGDALVRFIVDNNLKEARLGYATTAELIRELAARSEVSETIGEEWPKYRTVDSL